MIWSKFVGIAPLLKEVPPQAAVVSGFPEQSVRRVVSHPGALLEVGLDVAMGTVDIGCRIIGE